MYESVESENAVTILYELLNNVLNKSIPRKIISNSCNRYNYPIWYNSNIIRDIKQKSYYHKMCKKIRHGVEYDYNYKMFSDLRSKIKIGIRRAHADYLSKVEREITSYSGSFWK